MKKILFVIGTRPEAIKMAPLIQKFREDASFATKVLSTGQHRELLDHALKKFNIKPDISLDVMGKNRSLNHLFSIVLDRIEPILDSQSPDFVFVHGDTLTSAAAALACYHRQIKVGHVEAGLRSFNAYNPFPEEMYRRLTGQIAEYHFAPTLKARENLLREGISGQNIVLVGNTGIDALQTLVQQAGTARDNYILVTAHRRENTQGPGLRNICEAIKRIASELNVVVKYPVHPSPSVRGIVNSELEGLTNVELIEPLEYIDFITLMKNARIILTDSGGVQEEAPSLGVPVLVLRETTERPEGISAGCATLVGTDINNIFNEVSLLLKSDQHYATYASAFNPYGDGKASWRILNFMKTNQCEEFNPVVS